MQGSTGANGIWVFYHEVFVMPIYGIPANVKVAEAYKTSSLPCDLVPTAGFAMYTLSFPLFAFVLNVKSWW
jgi:hypothetical protein